VKNVAKGDRSKSKISSRKLNNESENNGAPAYGAPLDSASARKYIKHLKAIKQWRIKEK